MDSEVKRAAPLVERLHLSRPGWSCGLSKTLDEAAAAIERLAREVDELRTMTPAVLAVEAAQSLEHLRACLSTAEPKARALDALEAWLLADIHGPVRTVSVTSGSEIGVDLYEGARLGPHGHGPDLAAAILAALEQTE